MSQRAARAGPSGGGAKPRVLLVDDHRGTLDRVAAMLADDYDIAGVATDGGQALDTARHVAPDLIVLDINMPRVDGFQAMRALAEAGSPAPVVFLSMHDDEDTIAEAFRCGGRGYVLKSQMARDLGSALDQVRHGRLFAPSLESLFRLANGPGPQHAMQLYGAPASFLDGLAAVFDMALRRGDATCLIASGSELRDGLAARLHDRGWDVGEPSGHRRYRVIDAADALNGCMRNGRPDAQLLANAMAELEEYRAAVTNGAMGRLTVAGNMVAPLIAEGNLDAVLAIERLWNSLTQGLPVLTVCGYHTSCFHDDAPDLWSRVCTQHWAVSQSGDAGYSRQIPWS